MIFEARKEFKYCIPEKDGGEREVTASVPYSRVHAVLIDQIIDEYFARHSKYADFKKDLLDFITNCDLDDELIELYEESIKDYFKEDAE